MRLITKLHRKYNRWHGYLEGREVYHVSGENWNYTRTGIAIDKTDVALQSNIANNWQALGIAY